MFTFLRGSASSDNDSPNQVQNVVESGLGLWSKVIADNECAKGFFKDDKSSEKEPGILRESCMNERGPIKVAFLSNGAVKLPRVRRDCMVDGIMLRQDVENLIDCDSYQLEMGEKPLTEGRWNVSDGPQRTKMMYILASIYVIPTEHNELGTSR